MALTQGFMLDYIHTEVRTVVDFTLIGKLADHPLLLSQVWLAV
ncbi:MAG TPA: hypothetical protein VJR94_07570 [Candidatus Nitrosocosmicus sp.]|nr:hypothetical protein [Candidatus Nitrosocosmicus sp.]